MLGYRVELPRETWVRMAAYRNILAVRRRSRMLRSLILAWRAFWQEWAR